MAQSVDTFSPALGISSPEVISAAPQILHLPATRTSAEQNLGYLYAKRALDILVSVSLLILLAPLLLLLALAIRLDSPGPVIFTQRRVGKGGRIFHFFKYRSMYQHADPSVHREFARRYIRGEWNPRAGAARPGLFKPVDDKQVTRVGRFLRKTSLDELPQLFNILKGDMSLVGPRPSIAYELDEYAPWHWRRLEILPGLTGLAQIHGRSTLPFNEIVALDLHYIARQSLQMDIKILLQTIPVVLSCQGAR